MDLSDPISVITPAQNNRFLQLQFPRKDGPDAPLLPQEMHAVESMGKDFQFQVECLSTDAQLEQKNLMGKMVTISMQREDGSKRFFNGYIFAFSLRGLDGNLARYRMVLRPWLAFAELRRDNFLFHDQSLREQTTAIFAHYKAADWAWKCTGADPVYTDACQFNESDYNYLHRRWEARGLFYWYEHREDGHTLVIADDSMAQCPPIDGIGSMKWQSDAGSVEDDGVARFIPMRLAAPGAYAMSSWDFKNPTPLRASTPTVNQQGDVPALEIHDWGGTYAFAGQAEGEALTKRRIEALEAQAKRFEADGNERWAQAGRSFDLLNHFEFGGPGAADGDGEFLILQVHHHAVSNFPKPDGLQSSSDPYRCSFVCLRKKVPWRPLPGHNSAEPRIPGPQTAIVVGPKGEEIHTDKYGRVRVQFHWDRVGQYDERSSSWIRVASNWTGSGYGFIAIPRVGQEVVVSFLDGNPDRPLITGCVYNEHNLPAWGFPDAAHQTGIQSRSTPGGAGKCEMVIHDRAGHELINVFSQKDITVTALNNHSTVVEGPQRTIAVTTGTQATTVKKSIQVTSETEGIQHVARTAFEVNAQTQHILMEAKTDITLRVGKSKLQLSADGTITLEGVNIFIKGSTGVSINPEGNGT